MLNKRDDIGIWKSVTVAEMRKCLEGLPDNARLVPVQTGNLTVMEGEPGDEDNWEMLGFINIASGEYQD